MIGKKPMKGQVLVKLQNDAELKRLALWLTTINVDDLDDFRKPVIDLLNQNKTNTEIAQNLFQHYKKELEILRDFNEQNGIFFLE